jgi:hypothetical protein
VLMREGIVLTIDERAALGEAKRRGERIARASGLLETIAPAWPVL